VDRRERDYYLVSLDYLSYNYRLGQIKICVPSLKLHDSKKHEITSRYQQMFSCRKNESESLEYELRKAERRDRFCDWEKI
jgi:hypothetical protein